MSDHISKECRERTQATGNNNNGLNLGQNNNYFILLLYVYGLFHYCRCYNSLYNWRTPVAYTNHHGCCCSHYCCCKKEDQVQISQPIKNTDVI